MKRGIYIHIPFCKKKCFYCDFYSITDTSPVNEYVNALLKEIEYVADENSNSIDANDSIESIFIGGGTPSIIDPELIKLIIDMCKSTFCIEPQAEISIECNPGTVGIDYFDRLFQSGVNRLSIGVQSFNDDELSFLQRIHSAREAEMTILTARQAGFDNISLDLIFSIPNQTITSWTKTLSRAVALKTDHISAYSLIYEKGTPLFSEYKKGTIDKLGTKRDTILFRTTDKVLTKAGFEHYEVSNFAKPDKKCAHNLNYWRLGEYFGFGAAAHSNIGCQRSWNIKSVNKYINSIENGKLPVKGSEIISERQSLHEYLLLGLRSEGVSIDYLAEKFNMELTENLQKFIVELEVKGLAHYSDNFIKLSSSGFLVSNSIIAKFIDLLGTKS